MNVFKSQEVRKMDEFDKNRFVDDKFGFETDYFDDSEDSEDWDD